MAKRKTLDEIYGNLPEELIGVDGEPDDLPPIYNECELKNDRLFIVFEKGREQELADLLGLPMIYTRRKNIYTLDELIGGKNNGLL